MMISSNFPKNPVVRSAALVAIFSLVTADAKAQDFDFTVSTGFSSGTLTADFGLDMPSTLIGDYDFSSNPGGTQTRPGLIGGSGNNAIPTQIDVLGTFSYAGSPTGSWSMDIDTGTNTFDLTAFTVQVLGGGTVNGDQDTTLNFSTFRTFNPNSVFASSMPIVLDQGVVSATDFNIVQSNALETVAMVPTGNPDEWSFNKQVSVKVTFNADFLGTVVPVGPFGMTFPFEGILSIAPGASTASIDMDLTRNLFAFTPNPVPGFTMDDLPVGVETVTGPSPIGSIANLLLNGFIHEAFCDFDIVADWFIKGERQGSFSTYVCGPLNTNSTGNVGVLTVTGTPNVAANDLVFHGSDLPPGHFGILVMSQSQGNFVLGPPSQGRLCLGSTTPFYRLNNVISLANGAGMVTRPLNNLTLPQSQFFTGGDLWHFQYWHRDFNPGSTSNMTNGVSVQF